MKKYSTSCISSHTVIRDKEISLVSVANMLGNYTIMILLQIFSVV